MTAKLNKIKEDKKDTINKIARRIVDAVNPQKIILFGSYAKEIAKKDSDIDIYADTISKKVKNEIEKINSKINVKIGKYSKDSLLIKEIEKDHVIIKGIEVFYERNKFFD